MDGDQIERLKKKEQVFVELRISCTVRYDSVPSVWDEERVKKQAIEDAVTGLPQHTFVEGKYEADLWYEASDCEVETCDLEEPDF